MYALIANPLACGLGLSILRAIHPCSLVQQYPINVWVYSEIETRHPCKTPLYCRLINLHYWHFLVESKKMLSKFLTTILTCNALIHLKWKPPIHCGDLNSGNIWIMNFYLFAIQMHANNSLFKPWLEYQTKILLFKPSVTQPMNQITYDLNNKLLFGWVSTCTGPYQLPIFHCTNVHPWRYARLYFRRAVFWWRHEL